MAPFCGGRREGGTEGACRRGGGSRHRGWGCLVQGGTGPRVMPSMPAGGLRASGHPSLGSRSLGDLFLGPRCGEHGTASPHLPDSGQIFSLILPKLVHFTPALGLASCRALGCPPPSFSHAAAGRTLLKCKCDHVTPAEKPSQGKGQGPWPGIRSLAQLSPCLPPQPPLHPLPAPRPHQTSRIPHPSAQPFAATCFVSPRTLLLILQGPAQRPLFQEAFQGILGVGGFFSLGQT